VTNIKRLDRHNSSSGNVETEVGRVEYSGDDVGTRVQLCHLGMELCTPAIPRQRKRSHMSSFTAPSTSGSAPEAPRTVSTVAVRANDAGTALDAFRDFCLEKQKTKESSKGSSSQTDDPGFYDDQECIPDPYVTISFIYILHCPHTLTILLEHGLSKALIHSHTNGSPSPLIQCS
jgi:hypothetical protein